MIDPELPKDATHDVDKTMRRLRVVLMCIVGYVGLWDVAVTFGPLGVAQSSCRSGRHSVQRRLES